MFEFKGISFTDEEKKARVRRLFPGGGAMAKKDPNWNKKNLARLKRYGLGEPGELKNQSKNSKLPTEPEIQTRKSRREKMLKKERDIGKIQKNIEQSQGQATREDAKLFPLTRKKLRIERDTREPKKIQTEIERQENHMQETNQIDSQKNTQEENAVIPYMASKEISVDLKRELSRSTNLHEDTGNHLLGLMRSLTANRAPAEIIKVDPETAFAACKLADQIYKLGRLRLDAAEFIQKNLAPKDKNSE